MNRQPFRRPFKFLGVNLSLELHDRLRATAAANDEWVSDTVRRGLENALRLEPRAPR